MGRSARTGRPDYRGPGAGPPSRPHKASVLRNLRVDTVLFAGVNVDQCVLATLIDAACLGYDVVLVEDLHGTTSPAFCTQATLHNVRQCFGFTTTSAELLAGLPTDAIPEET